jgi:hypothetical protein
LHKWIGSPYDLDTLSDTAHRTFPADPSTDGRLEAQQKDQLMSNIALYTFGLLDPAIPPAKLADFVRRGGNIMSASDRAQGFLGRAAKDTAEPETHTPGEVYGLWGAYDVPDLPSFAGQNRAIHIATLSLWQDLETARSFVYHGLHRDALRIRYDWFLKGSWPGYVLWNIADGATPHWSDGVSRYQALDQHGESADRFTFSSRRSPA